MICFCTRLMKRLLLILVKNEHECIPFLSSQSNTHDFPVLNFLQHSKRTDAPGNFRNLNKDRIRSVVNTFISERGRVRQFCVRPPTCPENRFSTVQITVQFNKLTSFFYASVLLLMINCVIHCQSGCGTTSRRRVVPQ